MLCIEHLGEHERFLSKKWQVQEKLGELWRIYSTKFNETELIEKYAELRTRLFHFQTLKQAVEDLLSVRLDENLTIDFQIFERAIETINSALHKENFSTNVENHDETSSIFFSRSAPRETLPNENSVEENLFDSSSEIDSPNFPSAEDEMNIEQNREEILPTERKVVRAARIRDFCPLTTDGAFGIDFQHHGIRLCPTRNDENRRTYRLNEHFRRFHLLSPLASLKLVRAISEGQRPTETKLFTDQDNLLNVDAVRHVRCPINKPFVHHRQLKAKEFPCFETMQQRQLKDHLQKKHGFSTQAVRIIVNAIQSNKSVNNIQFPTWISILR